MPPTVPDSSSPVTVVIATRNRRESLLHTLARLAELPERPPVVVVDNGSQDGTTAAVRQAFPDVVVRRLRRNHGAVARNHGVRLARTAYVAFADDDSWWEPGSLGAAAAVLTAHPHLGGVIARVQLSPTGATDRVSHKLALARLGHEDDLPGPRTLSFPAFAAVLRRDAYLAAGGFSRLLFFGGEESLLAIDLQRAGHPLCYLHDVLAVHEPGNAVLSPERWAQHLRNDVLVSWLRRPLRHAGSETAGLVRLATRDRAAARALAGVVIRLPFALAARRPVPAELDHELTVTAIPAPDALGV